MTKFTAKMMACFNGHLLLANLALTAATAERVGLESCR